MANSEGFLVSFICVLFVVLCVSLYCLEETRKDVKKLKSEISILKQEVERG